LEQINLGCKTGKKILKRVRLSRRHYVGPDFICGR
jgi:hypothetical protein